MFCSRNHSRINYAIPILRRIHFSEISDWQVGNVLVGFESRTCSIKHLHKLVLAEVYHQVNLPARKLCPSLSTKPLVNSRGMELAVIKVGGFGVGGITNEITYCFAKDGKWKHLSSIPHVEQCNFGTSVLDNELYVVGGCFNQSLQENIHPFGFRYSPRYNKWSTMAPMQKERCRFSLNEVNGRLVYNFEIRDSDGRVNWCKLRVY